MKILLTLTSALCLSASTWAAGDPLWMRYPAISPDGETVAFTYKGDIYTVPAEGGRAMQLTTHPAYDTRPVWTPDGRQIVFASNRDGDFSIYAVSRDGGVPRRLTTHSAAEYPEAVTSDGRVLYSANIQPDRMDSQFPSGQFPQIYSVSLDGGRPELYSSLAMQNLSLSPPSSTPPSPCRTSRSVRRATACSTTT